VTYFPDLSEYSYSKHAAHNTLNVGWLSCDHPFPTGETSRRFRKRLRLLCEHSDPETYTLGFHSCELCPQPEEPGKTLDQDRFEAEQKEWGNKVFALPRSSAEIRVPGKGTVKYAAPVLIAHYVEAHHYLPPTKFIEAVQRVGAPHRRLLRVLFKRTTPKDA
jgi:hypothetical protein